MIFDWFTPIKQFQLLLLLFLSFSSKNKLKFTIYISSSSLKILKFSSDDVVEKSIEIHTQTHSIMNMLNDKFSLTFGKYTYNFS